MRITFDPEKDTGNIAKHGVSLALAGEIDGSMVMAYVDTRMDYREVREVGFIRSTAAFTVSCSPSAATR